MTLLHFDAAVSAPTRPAAPKVAPVLAETVTVTQLPSTSRAFVAVPVERWSAGDLRDYVVAAIEARFGAFPRDAKKEHGIFTRFAKEYGANAGRIAKYAFEDCDGWWMNAPVSINRFCKGSDKFFAQPILDRLSLS